MAGAQDSQSPVSTKGGGDGCTVRLLIAQSELIPPVQGGLTSCRPVLAAAVRPLGRLSTCPAGSWSLDRSFPLIAAGIALTGAQSLLCGLKQTMALARFVNRKAAAGCSGHTAA
jgi:hypothetical protein